LAGWVLGGASSPEANSFPEHVRAIWVVRESLIDSLPPERIPRIAAEMGANTLFVQISGRGDAWYDSAILPRAEALTPDGPDPFAALMEAAAIHGLSVHAWVNVGLVWSAPDPPKSPEHLVHSHPEWIMRLPDGRSMAELSREALTKHLAEGFFAETAHPGYRDHVAAVAREILTRYPVDGIHLDYIRRPSIDTGYDRRTLAWFGAASGFTPAELSTIVERESGGLPWSDYSDSTATAAGLAWNRYRRDAVTSAVRAVRSVVDSVAGASGRELLLTAAVIPDPELARRRYAQDWPQWVSRDLVDYVLPMCYRAGVQEARGQLGSVLTVAPADRVIAGVGIYQQPLGDGALTLRRMLDDPVRGVCVFSWGELEERDFDGTRLIRRAWLPAGRGHDGVGGSDGSSDEVAPSDEGPPVAALGSSG